MDSSIKVLIILMDSTYQSTDNPDGSVQLIKLMIDLNTFHTFKIIILKIVLVLAAIDETNFVGI
jgi:hypothetical protein